MEYKDQIKSPKWQKRRLEILKRDEFTCQECGNKDQTLHVHHKHYNKGAKIWEYEGWELTTLCDDCHSKTHNKIEIKSGQILVDKKFEEIYKLLSNYDDNALNAFTKLLYEIRFKVDINKFEYEEFWFKIFDSFNNDYINELIKICDDRLEKNEISLQINLLKEELDKLKNTQIQIRNKAIIPRPIISIKEQED